MEKSKLIPRVETLGLGIWWAWVWLCFFSDDFTSTIEERAQLWVVFLVTVSLVFVVALLLIRHQILVIHMRKLHLVAALVSSLGTLLMAFADNVLVMGVGSAIMGLGSVYWLLFWSEFSLTSRVVNNGVTVAASLLFGTLVYFVLFARPPVIGALLEAALPLISLAFVLLHPLPYKEIPQNPATYKLSKQFWALSRTVVVYTASFGVFEAYIADHAIVSINLVTIGGIGIAALVFGTIRLLSPHNSRLVGVYQSPLPFFVAGLVMLMISIPNNVLFAALLIMMGWATFFILSWTAVSQLISQGQLPLLQITAIAFCWQFGALLGAVVYRCFLIFGLANLGLLPLITIVVLVIVTSFGSFNGVGAGTRLTSENQEDPASANPYSTNNGIIKEICLQYGLSEREEEVLELLSRGRNVPQIVKTMHISKSTASTHTQHIYRKLHIHSRQELLDLLDTFDIHQ